MGNYLAWSRNRQENDEDSHRSYRSSVVGEKRKHRHDAYEADQLDEDFNTTLNLILSGNTNRHWAQTSSSRSNPNTVIKSVVRSSLYNRVVSSGFNKKSSQPNNETAMNALQKSNLNLELLTPNRKKMKSTTIYIYNTLFLNGEGSDIVVKALSKEWRLHKLYLCQSPYFDSMFKGSKWKESSQSYIELTIPDKNINEQALFITFGSFYSEDVEIVPLEAINVFACASLFSLDGLINQCEAIMMENINSHTVCAYYDAGLIYGINEVSQKALKWFYNNIITNQELKLGDIELPLFEKILSSNELMIIRVETDLYSLCKRWLYFQLNKNVINLESKSWQKITNEYFKELIKKKTSEVGGRGDKFCLLEDEAFVKYTNVFRKIRISNILGDLDSLKLLYNDRLIPVSWIEPLYFKNWLNVLFIDQDHLSNDFKIQDHDFENECMRFGRILDNDSFFNWRWVGFNYGIDLIVTHNDRKITLKRSVPTTTERALNSNAQPLYKGLISHKQTQRIYYMVKLVETDKFGNEVWAKQTEMATLDLHRNEEKHLFNIDPSAKYPLTLNIHVTSHPFYFSYFKNAAEEQPALNA